MCNLVKTASRLSPRFGADPACLPATVTLRAPKGPFKSRELDAVRPNSGTLRGTWVSTRRLAGRLSRALYSKYVPWFPII